MPAAGRPASHRAAVPHPPAARYPRLPDASRWHWWLLLPVALPLLTPLYNRVDPRLFGMPFFYWFQLAFAALSTVVVSAVHLGSANRQP